MNYSKFYQSIGDDEIFEAPWTEIHKISISTAIIMGKDLHPWSISCESKNLHIPLFRSRWPSKGQVPVWSPLNEAADHQPYWWAQLFQLFYILSRKEFRYAISPEIADTPAHSFSKLEPLYILRSSNQSILSILCINDQHWYTEFASLEPLFS
jgi:hypothetical protein